MSANADETNSRMFLDNLKTTSWVPRDPKSREEIPQVSSSGDHSAVAPPVPIPNTEVKRCSPDGSASIGCARVGRCQFYDPRSLKNDRGSFFCCLRGDAVLLRVA
jgi:hypothetical protein